MGSNCAGVGPAWVPVAPGVAAGWPWPWRRGGAGVAPAVAPEKVPLSAPASAPLLATRPTIPPRRTAVDRRGEQAAASRGEHAAPSVGEHTAPSVGERGALQWASTRRLLFVACAVSVQAGRASKCRTGAAPFRRGSRRCARAATYTPLVGIYSRFTGVRARCNLGSLPAPARRYHRRHRAPLWSNEGAFRIHRVGREAAWCALGACRRTSTTHYIMSGAI